MPSSQPSQPSSQPSQSSTSGASEEEVAEAGRQEIRRLESKRVAEERRRAGLAPAFDRLLETNLLLVASVGRLVNVSYLLMVAQTLVLAYLIYHGASK